MSAAVLLKKQLTPTKLLFHILFWGFHWGIFAYGWYVLIFSVGGRTGLGQFLQRTKLLTQPCIGGSKQVMPV